MAKRSRPKEYDWIVFKNKVDKDGGTAGRITIANTQAPDEAPAIQRAFVEFGIDKFDDRARIRAETLWSNGRSLDSRAPSCSHLL